MAKATKTPRVAEESVSTRLGDAHNRLWCASVQAVAKLKALGVLFDIICDAPLPQHYDDAEDLERKLGGLGFVIADIVRPLEEATGGDRNREVGEVEGRA